MLKDGSLGKNFPTLKDRIMSTSLNTFLMTLNGKYAQKLLKRRTMEGI
jgi:hypothetical protein